MSDWMIHVHIDDEEQARNMMEELNRDGFAVHLYKWTWRSDQKMVLQHSLLPAELNGNGA
jgi:hypothetical protein